MKNLTGIYLFVPLWGTKTEKPTGSRKPVLYFLIIKANISNYSSCTMLLMYFFLPFLMANCQTSNINYLTYEIYLVRCVNLQ